MALLADLLADQYAFFAGVSKDWNRARGVLPKTARAITVDTSVSQLLWSFDNGPLKTPII